MTYDQFMNKIFWMCVDALNEWAALMGWTYEELNIWIFIVAHPLLTLFLFFMVWWQKSAHYRHIQQIHHKYLLYTSAYLSRENK